MPAAGIDYAPEPPGGEGSAQHLQAQINEHQTEIDRLKSALAEKEKEDEQAVRTDRAGPSAEHAEVAGPDHGPDFYPDKLGPAVGAKKPEPDHGKGGSADQPFGQPKHGKKSG